MAPLSWLCMAMAQAENQEETHHPNPWSTFWRSTVQFQSDKLNPWVALRNAVGVVLPLAAGVALGSPSGGLAMSSGALNVAFPDSDAPYAQRARQMLLASVVAGVAVCSPAGTGADPT